MLYKFWNGLLNIDSKSKHAPTSGNQNKSCHQTSSCSSDIPFHRTQYRQQTLFPCTIPEQNSLPNTVATAPSLAFFEARVQRYLY